MSRAKSYLVALPLTVLIAVTGCKTVPADENALDAQAEAAVLAALEPATAEEIAIANRADPLTKANFWSGEYRKDPTNLAVNIAFVDALRGIGTHEKAIEIAQKAIVLHPDSVDLVMSLGRAHSSAGQLEPAAVAYNRAAGIAPNKVETWAALGSALDRLGLHSDAQRAYVKALELEPARTKTLANYGLSLAMTGDLQKAESKLKLAADAPDATVKIKENYALVLGLKGDFDTMRKVSGAGAPPDVIEQNISVLQALQSPARSWEDMVEEAENAPIPRAPMNAEVPEKAASVAVEVADVDSPANIQPAPAAKAPVKKKGLGLRGSMN